MKIVTAIDSFKGSMTSMEAGQAAAEGILRVDADAEVIVRPLADGGEGTVEALVSGMNGTLQKVQVTGPLGEPVICEYGIIESTKTAVIEMAGAAGITLVSDEERNPLNTTTYGVGEVIRDAIDKGCRRFLVGIGGSATNDGGVGMLQALGYGFLDKDGNQVPFGAKGLKVLEKITDTYVLPELKECKFKIACAANGQDDYASMREMLTRRVQRYVDGDEKFAPLPNAFMIDGGLGHVHVCKEVLDSFGLSVPCFGMVKDDRHRTRALVAPDGREFGISATPALFALIGRMQEEVHRFAIEYNRKLGGKKVRGSTLDKIPGVGDKRRTDLLKHFGSIENIRQASEQELARILPRNAAQSVYEFFHQDS